MNAGSEAETLVIGRGIAGLAAAIGLGERGVQTLVAFAGADSDGGNTAWAQGGIVFGEGATDALQRTGQQNAGLTLRDDILRAGCFENWGAAVDQLVEAGPAIVRSLLLDRANVQFARGLDGGLLRTTEGGHSEARILFHGDETGAQIAEALWAYAQTLPSVRFLSNHIAVNLLMTPTHAIDPDRVNGPARCFGAFLLDGRTNEVSAVRATNTVLATGGVGQLYLHNTNSRHARGDGLALAHRAGARLSHLEYVQFHPTTFFHPEGRRFLVSEAVRGEGAVLVNAKGDRFLSRYLPEEKVPELAPRDRVARAIHEEMLRTGSPCVYLDVRHHSREFLERRFPFLYRSCAQYGVHIERDPIPVVPAAHYHCGGVWTDLQGQTSVAGLWAAGEVAYTGLHGANRLASTSLLEGLVWGTRAGIAISDGREGKSFDRHRLPEVEDWRHESDPVDPGFVEQDWLTLRQTMWNYAGLLKSESRLERARGILDELSRGTARFYRRARLTEGLVALRHGVLAAGLILDSCERNFRSLGCFRREP